MLKNKKGVTLIEILVAIAIIGGSMVSIINSFFQIRKNSDLIFGRVLATFLMYDVMERIEATNPAQFTAGTTVTINDVYNDIKEKSTFTTPASLIPYSGERNIFGELLRGFKLEYKKILNLSTGSLGEITVNSVPVDCVAYIVNISNGRFNESAVTYVRYNQ